MTEASKKDGGAPVDEAAMPCPLCGYDLRGLPPGRCPECGHGFDPAELRAALDARRRERDNRPLPWLVEYASIDTAAGRFSPLLTPLAAAVPWWFWRTLRPHMPVRPGRLALYRVAAVAVALVLIFFGWTSGLFYEPVSLFLFALFWPTATLACLTSFRASLRMARIDGRHVWRCVGYAGDAALWAVPFGVLINLAVDAGLLPRTWDSVPGLKYVFFSYYPSSETTPILTTIALIAFFWLRLTVAYRQYLRFRHATATVAATQVIVILLALLLQCASVGL